MLRRLWFSGSEDVLVGRLPPAVLEIILAEPVAVERVEQVDGPLYGAIGEVVCGWHGLGLGFEVELDERSSCRRCWWRW